jgi:hypothetical protein
MNNVKEVPRKGERGEMESALTVLRLSFLEDGVKLEDAVCPAG